MYEVSHEVYTYGIYIFYHLFECLNSLIIVRQD